jgi:hypothetical protein
MPLFFVILLFWTGGLFSFFIQNIKYLGNFKWSENEIYTTVYALGFAVLVVLIFLLLIKPRALIKHFSFNVRILSIPISIILISEILMFWPFDLDDKWINFRISRNILEIGLPLINVDVMRNVNTSFIYNYLLLPGHLFLGGGEFNYETYMKLLGIFFLIVSSILIVKNYTSITFKILSIAGLLLFPPYILWLFGGLETALIISLLIALHYLVLARKLNLNTSLFLFGALIWVRPETILIGLGILFVEFSLNFRVKSFFKSLLSFSSPVFLFLVINKVFFQDWLPQTAYVKGIYNAFSAREASRLEKALTGAGELLSLHLTSIIFTTALILTLIMFLKMMMDNSDKSKILSLFKQNSNFIGLYIGNILLISFAVISGYQHMGFAFRYYLPGIIGIFILNLKFIEANVQRLNFKKFRLFEFLPAASNIIVIGQILVTIFITIFIKYQFFTPTFVTKDNFGLESYKDYVATWRVAGREFQKIAKPEDRLFLEQGLVVGAFTKSYWHDWVYTPLVKSSYPDLVECGRGQTGQDCRLLFDYLVTFSPEYFSQFGGLPDVPWKMIYSSSTISIWENTLR